MRRLIDSDALLESLISCNGLGRKSCELVVNVIKSQPTAFDVDKVVEHLEERKKYYEGKLNEQSGRNEDIGYWEDVKAYKDAIEIVKGGGIDA